MVVGDYDVIPTELDVYAPERWRDDALFEPEVREAYRRLVAQGWTDALGALHPTERIYTFWDYFGTSDNRSKLLIKSQFYVTTHPWFHYGASGKLSAFSTTRARMS